MKPPVDRVAADWLARSFAGLSPQEKAAFHRWYHSDPVHAETYDELEATWRELDRIRLPEARAGDADPDALAPSRGLVFRRWWAPLLTAAALVLVAWISEGMMARKEQEAGLRTPFTERVVTAVGEWRRLSLPDGSSLHVNTDSHVEVAYSRTERRVRLQRGEAHFAVKKDPARPFFVEADGVAVRAVGTAFNVRLRADAVEVLVTEGRVRVADTVRDESLVVRPLVAESPKPPLLAAGERVLIASSVGAQRRPYPAAAEVVTSREMERALAWQDRRIRAAAEPLGQLAAEFNRYNQLQIVVADPVLAERRFGGSFRADDAETFVRLLETRFGLRVERLQGSLVLHP